MAGSNITVELIVTVTNTRLSHPLGSVAVFPVRPVIARAFHSIHFGVISSHLLWMMGVTCLVLSNTARVFAQVNRLQDRQSESHFSPVHLAAHDALRIGTRTCAARDDPDYLTGMKIVEQMPARAPSLTDTRYLDLGPYRRSGDL